MAKRSVDIDFHFLFLDQTKAAKSQLQETLASICRISGAAQWLHTLFLNYSGERAFSMLDMIGRLPDASLEAQSVTFSPCTSRKVFLSHVHLFSQIFALWDHVGDRRGLN